MEKFAINVKIKRLSETAKIPTKAHESDAAFDIYADIQDTFVPFGKSIDESEKGIKVMPGHFFKQQTAYEMPK